MTENSNSTVPASAADVRAWAKASGYAVASRGKIPAEVQREYDAAHAAV